MPEGPEIHRQADQIREAVSGKLCRYIFFYHEHLKPYEKELAETEITSVEAFGKGLLISFENRKHIFSHNQLYGKWFVKPAGEYPGTGRSLRLEIQGDHHSALLYSASEIEVLDDEQVHTHPYLSRIGPDVLRCEDTGPVEKQLQSSSFKNRSFSALLLDQHFLAGIGNYLRSEILFHAGIHPSEKPSKLSDEKLAHFAKSALLIAHRSYRLKGITLDEKRVNELKKAGKKRKGYRHYVFGREGQPCHICGKEIIKLRMGGRRLYLCEQCQR